MRRDPLGDHQPHTPRPGQLPDPNKPTCSQPGGRNKGCSMYRFCNLGLKEHNAGPVQVAVEEHHDVKPGEGRRVPMWCFIAFRKHFGPNPQPGYTLCEDRIYYERDGAQWKAVQLKPYEEQGPYHYAPESAAPDPVLIEQRRKLLEEATSGAGRATARRRHANDPGNRP